MIAKNVTIILILNNEDFKKYIIKVWGCPGFDRILSTYGCSGLVNLNTRSQLNADKKQESFDDMPAFMFNRELAGANLFA